MSIQNLSIIFIVIAIPIIIVSSYYVTQQQETLKMQASYDSKLGEATREAIKAYEINTVEWANEKENTRKHTMAAMNVFMTSLANQLNISGTAKEYMQNYIPAMAMTMYDGYYIYAPAYVPVTLKTEEGTQLFYDSENDILTTESENPFLGTEYLIAYEPEGTGIISSTETGEQKEFVTTIEQAKKEHKHTLTNQIPYSSRITTNNIDVVINYTLDNLIYIYGYLGNGTYIEEKGHFVYFSDAASVLGVPQIENGTESKLRSEEDGLTFKYTNINNKKLTIQGEKLKEQIAYRDNSNSIEAKNDIFNFVYDSDGTKLYYDENEESFFSLKKDRTRYYIDNSSKIYYKAVVVIKSDVGKTKLYQALNGGEDIKGKWFYKRNNGEYVEAESQPDTDVDDNILLDYSAVNYYVEAWNIWAIIAANLSNIDEEFRIGEKQFKNPFEISTNNDPEDENSLFSQYRKEVIKNSIISNLNIVISNYAQGGIYSFRMPILKDSDWEQIYNNISLITFFQGVPIGTKHYNNYAIATSSTNREIVNPAELYMVSNNDSYYHKPLCNQIANTGYTAYKSIDFELKEKYISEELGYTKYYAQPKKACYYCIINRANYEQMDETGDVMEEQKQAYYTALARERYINANT